MLSNKAVVQAWVRGKKARGNRIHTDGRILFSYALPIGITDTKGRKWVFPFTAKDGLGVSATTSRHVNLAKEVADHVADVEDGISVFLAWRNAAWGKKEKAAEAALLRARFLGEVEL